MTNKYLPIDQILAILKETPPRLTKLTSGLIPVQLHTAPSAGEWSVNKVRAHLHACDDVWGNYYIMTILEQDKPTIKARNPRTWIKDTDYLQQDFQSSLRAFAKQRRKLLLAIGIAITKGLGTYEYAYRGGKASPTNTSIPCRWVGSP